MVNPHPFSIAFFEYARIAPGKIRAFPIHFNKSIQITGEESHITNYVIADNLLFSIFGLWPK